MPPCPLLTKGESLSNSTKLALPAKSPITAKTGIKGTFTLVDQAGNTVANIHLDATIQ
jgi:hypothetical protein